MAMKKVSVTYAAPPGDSKVAEMFGHTFYHGKEETIVVDERTLGKLQGSKLFTCSEPQDVEGDEKSDPAQQEAENERLEREDQQKRAAQGPNPVQRGALLNPAPGEQPDAEDASDEEKRERQRQPTRERGATGGAPDPSQAQGKKEEIPREGNRTAQGDTRK